MTGRGRRQRHGRGVLSGGVCESARREISFARGHGGSGEHLERAHYLTLYEAPLLTACHEPPAAVVEPVRGSSGDLLAPGSRLGWRVASLSRSERGRVGACARALLQGEPRRAACAWPWVCVWCVCGVCVVCVWC